MTSLRPLQLAFLVSGVAGLSYEVLWSRYLGLFVGHSSYAQVLVLAVYLGGMAVGAAAIAPLSKRLESPLRGYAYAELALAGFGLLFHPIYLGVTGFSYETLFPLLGSPAAVGAARWGMATLMILPQAVILGVTFPLMAAGLVRAAPGTPGAAVSDAYLLNTLGAAAGVLLAGFWWIGSFGLAGTSITAAVLNLVSGGLVLRVVGRSETPRAEAAPAEPPPVDGSATIEHSDPPDPEAARWTPVLLGVAFLTAVASFAYEIGWIRMLSLVLGSATHAFELMLSAFILGLAIGSRVVRARADSSSDSIKRLARIQIWMGLTALLSLPAYVLTFPVMAAMVGTLPDFPAGYFWYNLARYGLCLLVMLPSTVLAGMTLPVITGNLLHARAGEVAIGRVYSINTAGSVLGAGFAGLVALPLLGLEGVIAMGAGLDILLGLALLGLLVRSGGMPARRLALTTGAAALIFVAVVGGVEFSPTVLTSGVYRTGDLPTEEQHASLYYADGRTATVSAHVGTGDGVIVLSTNGKPDASLGPRWRRDGRDTVAVEPIPVGRDYTTQVLAPMVGLGHRPDARSVVNIGHGSGLTAAAFLTSRSLEQLFTVEIEPLMVEGSFVFLPANASVFEDERSAFVFGDAKSYLSYAQHRFDIAFAEPSNPWVSGTSTLFTIEFYERLKRSLTDDGVLVQWMQLYEITDDLFLTVLAAIDASFPAYRAYMVGDSDVAIVASLDASLAEADWSVVTTPEALALTEGAPPLSAQAMDALFMFDQETFRPILGAVTPNSDFRPVLDTGAERARFEGAHASGVHSFAASRVDLARVWAGIENPPDPFRLPTSAGLEPIVLAERAAWLREALAAGGGIAPETFPDWTAELVHLDDFLDESAGSAPRLSWEAWSFAFSRAEAALHWGTWGSVDTTFYAAADAFLERAGAPAAPRATVALARAYSEGSWDAASAAADQIIARVAGGERWAEPSTLLDMAVVSHLRAGRAQAARNAFVALAPHSRRSDRHLRMRLLDALIDEAEAAN